MAEKLRQMYYRHEKIFYYLTRIVKECHQFFEQKMNEYQPKVRILHLAYSRSLTLQYVLQMHMPDRPSMYHSNLQRLRALYERVNEFLTRFKIVKFTPPGAIKPRDRIIILSTKPQYKPQYVTPDEIVLIDVKYLFWIHAIKQELYSYHPDNEKFYLDMDISSSLFGY